MPQKHLGLFHGIFVPEFILFTLPISILQSTLQLFDLPFLRCFGAIAGDFIPCQLLLEILNLLLKLLDFIGLLIDILEYLEILSRNSIYLLLVLIEDANQLVKVLNLCCCFNLSEILTVFLDGCDLADIYFLANVSDVFGSPG